MQQYMLLIYGEESVWANMTPDQLSQEMGAYMAYTQDLQKAGVYIAGHELQPVETAKTVSVSGGKQKVVDGPFAETKEALGGYYLRRKPGRSVGLGREMSRRAPRPHRGAPRRHALAHER
jgi:hypothetical protein